MNYSCVVHGRERIAVKSSVQELRLCLKNEILFAFAANNKIRTHNSMVRKTRATGP